MVMSLKVNSMRILSQYLNWKATVNYSVWYESICGEIYFYLEKRLEEYMSNYSAECWNHDFITYVGSYVLFSISHIFYNEYIFQ